MITNVTNVFVGSGKELLTSMPTPAVSKSAAVADAGKLIAVNVSDTPDKFDEIKIGIVTDKVVAFDNHGTQKFMPVIKWAAPIKNAAVKKIALSTYKESTPDKVDITFNEDNGDDVKRIMLRVTYKDMETRYRKWTETYEVVVAPEATAEEIAAAFGKTLLKNSKRNRFDFEVSGTTLTLTAKQYDDDDAVDTINVSKKVRFDVHMYYTLPNADGWASKNKYAYSDATITKTEGEEYAATAKLVRDREAWAMGYQGILNRGECTWPIIKPSMAADITKQYDYAIVEFETMYRAADDIQRYTKECLEVYEVHSSKMEIKDLLDKWINGNSVAGAYATSVAEAPTKAKQG